MVGFILRKVIHNKTKPTQRVSHVCIGIRLRSAGTKCPNIFPLDSDDSYQTELMRWVVLGLSCLRWVSQVTVHCINDKVDAVLEFVDTKNIAERNHRHPREHSFIPVLVCEIVDMKLTYFSQCRDGIQLATLVAPTYKNEKILGNEKCYF